MLFQPIGHRHILAIAILLGTLSSTDANAQRELSCGLYNQLNFRCNCTGQDNYLLSYGLKYCKRFLGATRWSPAGAEWRNQTLACLQNEMVQHLATTSSHACDCKKIKEFASETHILCYTQQVASVCRLPPSDLREIYRIIDAADLFDLQGIKQLLGIARICIAQWN
jgi:hypothetical protein